MLAFFLSIFIFLFNYYDRLCALFASICVASQHTQTKTQTYKEVNDDEEEEKWSGKKKFQPTFSIGGGGGGSSSIKTF